MCAFPGSAVTALLPTSPPSSRPDVAYASVRWAGLTQPSEGPHAALLVMDESWAYLAGWARPIIDSVAHLGSDPI